MENTTQVVNSGADQRFGPQLPGYIDFTLLFEDSILTLLPTCILILATPVWLIPLYQRRPMVSSGYLLSCKLMAAAFIFGMSLCNLIVWATSKDLRTESSLAATCISCVGAVCIMAMIHADHVYTLRSSRLLSIYLSISILFDIAKTRSYIIRGNMTVPLVICISTIIAKIGLVAFEEVSKRPWLKTNYSQLNAGREALSGFWNHTLFLWLNPTFKQGFKNILELKDLEALDPELRSEYLHTKFYSRWKRGNKTSKYCLVWTWMKSFDISFILFMVSSRLILLGAQFAQPFLVRRVVDAVDEKDLSSATIGGLIGAGALIFLLTALSGAAYFQAMARACSITRSTLTLAIYNKVFKISRSELTKLSALTLMSTDVIGVDRGLIGFNETWACAIAVPVGMYILFLCVGYAAFLVLIPITLTTILSYFVSLGVRDTQKVWNQEIESRVAFTADALQNIQSIKMSGLEDAVADSLQDSVKAEVKCAKVVRIYDALLYGLGTSAELLNPTITLAGSIFWTRATNGIAVGDVFAALTVVLLISEPLATLTHSFAKIARVLACLGRVQDFLLLEENTNLAVSPAAEIDTTENTLPSSGSSDREGIIMMKMCSKSCVVQGVEMRDASSTITAPDNLPIIRRVNVQFPWGEISVIDGQVGCGKSTLLQMLIGEEPLSHGNIFICEHGIAFCGQSPWIQNKSIQENIVGPNNFSVSWYNKVLDACNLRPDLESMAKGDQTQAGNGGENLSGGQKQRVALARALYIKARVLVLDDIFGSLDQVTRDLIFERLFGYYGILRRSRTTVIVTTSVAYQHRHVDAVFRLNEDRSIEQLSKDGCDKKGKWVENKQQEQEQPYLDIDLGLEDLGNLLSNNSPPVLVTESNGHQDPRRQRGDRAVYAHYMRSFGWTKIVIWIVLLFGDATLEKFPQIYLRIWLSINPDNKLYFIGYAAISVLGIISYTMLMGYFLSILVSISYENMHHKLVKKVFGATWSFLSTTDRGTLLNRFSQDLSLIGQDLPVAGMVCLFYVCWTIVELGIIASGARYAALLIPPFLLALYALQAVYLRTARQIRFLSLEAKSPLYNLFAEVSSGMDHIRTFGWVKEYRSRGIELLDLSQRPSYLMQSIQGWLGLVLDMIILGVAVFLITLALVLREYTSQAGIGLALLNIVGFNQTVGMLLKNWTTMESALGAVARMKSFEEETPTETDMDNMENAETEVMDSKRPSAGRVEFKDVSVKYDECNENSPSVLKHINFTAKPGQRVGISGRTGSGKTSLIMTTLRLLNYSGSILIDGVELRDIPHNLLRKSITTVPQDAIEIAGSVRHNLYPLPDKADVKDSTMIFILTRLQLWAQLQDRGGLDADIKSLSLSHGQKQLMSLARAMVHHIHTRSKIVLMDEGTSQIDRDTEKMVQQVITEVFADCTMLVVAHRRETIRNMNIILEMSRGKVFMEVDRDLLNSYNV